MLQRQGTTTEKAYSIGQSQDAGGTRRPSREGTNCWAIHTGAGKRSEIGSPFCTLSPPLPHQVAPVIIPIIIWEFQVHCGSHSK